LLYQLYAPYPVGVNPFKTAFEEVLRLEKAKERHDNEPATSPMVATLEVILNGKGAQVRSQVLHSALHSTLSHPSAVSFFSCGSRVVPFEVWRGNGLSQVGEY
jgi:hypothetical protein